MSTMAPQITSLTIVCSNAYSGVDQRRHQTSASLAFVCGIHRWPVRGIHKGPVTRKMFQFDDVIMIFQHGIPTYRTPHTVSIWIYWALSNLAFYSALSCKNWCLVNTLQTHFKLSNIFYLFWHPQTHFCTRFVICKYTTALNPDVQKGLKCVNLTLCLEHVRYHFSNYADLS